MRTKVSEYFTAMEQISPDRRLELQRAAGIVNQLNLTDSRINREKTAKLLNFLAGKPIDSSKISTNGETVLTKFVKNYITNTIVKLGHDKQAAAVDVYSRLLIDLMVHHLDMWHLFQYYICTTCPYLMPFNPVEQDLPGEELLMKTMGPRPTEFIDGYFGRMGTCAQMYGLVLAMITKKPRFPVQAQSIGWDLLARIMCVAPGNGVTAAVLLNFLNTAGFFLQQAYGKQFLKLMDYLSTEYLPKIEKVSKGGGKQACTLLKNFLNEFNATRKMKQSPMIEKYQ